MPRATSQVPEQQSRFSLQGAPVEAHGSAHVPLVAPGGTSHTCPAQQSTSIVHGPAHHGVHVPLVEPSGTSHQPPQQSELPRQTPPAGTQTGAHAPLVAPGGISHASPGQHSAVTVQPAPTTWQTGRPHAPSRHEPEQHSGSAWHVSPSGRHVTSGMHRRTPPRSIRQDDESPQHCSENWQIEPSGMHMSGGSQRRFVQLPEQHSAPLAHLVPLVAQPSGIGTTQIPAPAPSGT
ncbi:MAG TPA: hypothetical protein VFL83_23180 [Anaeromyxobacter sp.]|nr:hypothetical protein [Anaeromyxobacter sp.]